jgi:uncharacterized protein YjdB
MKGEKKMKKGTKFAALLLSLALIIPACTQKPASESKPVDQTSQPSDVSSDDKPVSSDDQPSSQDEVKYTVTISNKTELQAEWFAGDPSRKVNIEIEPKANITQLVNEGKIQITSSNAEVASVTGQMVNPVAAGKATITVKCGDSQDTVEVTLLAKQTVKEKYGVAHEGTAEDPFTNEDACKVAKSDKYNNEDFYVKGVVDRFYYAPGARDDGAVAFYLVPATEGGEQFEVFKCFKDKEQKEKLTADDIWVGGTVTAHGQFTVYNKTQAETTSAIFVKCEGEKPKDPVTIEKSFAEVLALGVALKDGSDSYDFYKFQGYVTKKDGNNYWLTATKGEALVSGKSDAAHGERDIYTNGIELYGAGKVAELAAKLLENALVEVTMVVKNYHGTVENSGNLKDADVVVKEAGTAWSVPEPAVANATIAEFIGFQNTKAKAYNVTGQIKSFKDGDTKDAYGNMVLTDGTNDLIIYGATMTASALAWDNAGAYAFTNPKDFMTNATSNALAIGTTITMKLVRNDYTSGGNTTIEGVGVIVNIQAVAATGVQLDKTAIEVEVDKSEQLTATILPVGATGTISWSSTDATIASVDTTGKVRGVAPGTATITAALGDFTASCVVTVKAGEVKTEAVYNLIKCGSTSGYAQSSDITFEDGKVWNIPGNQTLSYGLKIGGKLSEATDRALYSKDAYSTVSSIVVTHGTKDAAITVNSVKLYVYDTAEKAAAGSPDAADETVVGTFVDAGKTTFAPASGNPWQNKYFRLVYNMSSSAASSNKGVVLTELKLNFVAGETPATKEAMPWFTTGEGNQAIHFEGAGIWTWVNYGTMGYADFAAFNAAKENIVAAYESDPAATINDKVVSDDIAASKVCRVYIVLSAAHNTGKLTLTIPGADGKTYEGTLEFAEGTLTKVNGVAF